MKIVSAVLGVLLLVALGLLWWQRERAVDLQRERNNAVAERDTLRLLYASRGDSVRVYARKIVTLEDTKEIAKIAAEEAVRAAEEAGLQLTAALDMAFAFRDSIRTLTRARSLGRDSTEIPIDVEQGALLVRGDVRFPGRIEPDPEPETEVRLDAVLREIAIEVLLAEDPETCAPEVLLRTSDPHVRALRAEGVIDQRSTCLDDLGGWFDFGGGFATGAGVGAGTATVLFLLFGR